MKKITLVSIVLVGALMMMVSCGGGVSQGEQQQSNSDDEKTSLGEAVSALGGLKKMADQADDMGSLQKKLSKMQPVSNETLKKVLPETLMGMKRTKYSINSNEMFGNLLMGSATYTKDDDHDIELSITDGAGETGSSVLMLAIWGLRADMEEETESGFTKTIEKDGRHIKVKQKKQGDNVRSELTTAIRDRFLVKLDGNNFTVDELQKAYDALDFGALED